MSTVEEGTGLDEDVAEFNELDLLLGQALVRLHKLVDTLLKLVSAESKLVDLVGVRGGSNVGVSGNSLDLDASLLDLGVEEAELTLNVVKTTDLLDEGTLEGVDVRIELFDYLSVY